jgi:hypothetical protein
VACGSYGTLYNCGTCSAANGAPGVSTSTVQQGCL